MLSRNNLDPDASPARRTGKQYKLKRKTHSVSITLPTTHNRRLYFRELRVHLVHPKDAFRESVWRAVGNTVAREVLEFIEEVAVFRCRVRHVVHREELCKHVLRNLCVQLLEACRETGPRPFAFSLDRLLHVGSIGAWRKCICGSS